MTILPSPANISPLDPDEFIAALQYAVMVVTYEFLEEIPAVGKPFLATDAGLVALTNIPENRFGWLSRGTSGIKRRSF